MHQRYHIGNLKPEKFSSATRLTPFHLQSKRFTCDRRDLSLAYIKRFSNVGGCKAPAEPYWTNGRVIGVALYGYHKRHALRLAYLTPTRGRELR
ncbi:MAG: hypothetical protein N3G20_08370 [Verrucomicrobiae bacterium]|nr:hypothetical protein [Verrucomicrobiae bacterium]